ncbi:MAG: HEPN/Toprim-associated domain-containing protein [Phycisphaerales bacterium]|jgi:hypothetical protein
MITLALGKLEVDWGKNRFFSDHGSLFQTSDLKPVPSYYASEDWPDGDPVVEMNEGFGKPLGEVVDRLELLGVTMAAVEHQYAELHQFHDLPEQPIPFRELCDALVTIDVSMISGDYSGDYDPGEFVWKEILDRLRLSPEGQRSDLRDASLLLEGFSANATLRLLARNPKNLDLDVSWDFGPLVREGWATRQEFQAGASRGQRFLVVAEGSSDAKIIQQALRLYRPHIADFFQFIDMEEGYPFAGTGNLHRFTQGLVSIGIQNNTIILYDNDAAGVAQYNKTKSLSLPANLKVLHLPDLPELSNIATMGPEGVSSADVNGRAASIECYLDLNRSDMPEPQVRWTMYDQDTDRYHGVLEHKTKYMKDFLNLRIANTNYDSTKIEAVLDAIVAQCVSIAEAKLIGNAFPR